MFISTTDEVSTTPAEPRFTPLSLLEGSAYCNLSDKQSTDYSSMLMLSVEAAGS